MPRYVDLDKLVSELDEHYETLGKKYGFDDMYVRGYGEAINDMEDKSEADVQEVMHGKWELIDGHQSRCSKCGLIRNIATQVGWDFCPNCGCKLDNSGDV